MNRCFCFDAAAKGDLRDLLRAPVNAWKQWQVEKKEGTEMETFLPTAGVGVSKMLFSRAVVVGMEVGTFINVWVGLVSVVAYFVEVNFFVSYAVSAGADSMFGGTAPLVPKYDSVLPSRNVRLGGELPYAMNREMMDSLGCLVDGDFENNDWLEWKMKVMDEVMTWWVPLVLGGGYLMFMFMYCLLSDSIMPRCLVNRGPAVATEADMKRLGVFCLSVIGTVAPAVVLSWFLVTVGVLQGCAGKSLIGK